MIPAPRGYSGKTYIRGLYVYEHRYLMEKKLGRLLLPGEVVHHINGDRLDNLIENLVVIAKIQHDIHHNGQRRSVPNTICPTCGKPIYRARWHMKYFEHKYCSRACQNIGLRK